MNLEDELRFTIEERRPAGSPISSITVVSKNIKKLIQKFKNEGIEIYLDNSEQDIEYRIDNEEKRSTIPFGFKINGQKNVECVGYHLRNNQLEIILKNYYENSGGIPGRYGGQITTEHGVYCKVSIKGNDDKEVNSTFNKAKSILKDFYKIDRTKYF